MAVFLGVLRSKVSAKLNEKMRAKEEELLV
jgi:hypothetical protein